MSVPIEVDASEKREKNESMRPWAVIDEDLYDEIRVRNLFMLDESFRKRVLARSMTSRWRSWRACSWGDMLARSSPSRAPVVLSTPEDEGRETVVVDGCELPAGARAGGGVGAAVNCPPKVRVEIDCALWIAICRWKACWSRGRGWALEAGIASALGSRPRPRPRLSLCSRWLPPRLSWMYGAR